MTTTEPRSAASTRRKPLSDSPRVVNADFVAPKPLPPAQEQEETKAVPPYKPGKYKEPVEQVYNLASLFLLPVAPRTAMAIQEQKEVNGQLITTAEDCAIEADKLAAVNPKFRAVLDKYLMGGQGLAFAMANLPIAVAAASELGLVSQVSNLVGKLFKRKNRDEEPEEVQFP